MNSIVQILHRILFDSNTTVYILITVSIILLALIIHLKVKLKNLLGGKNAKNIEEAMKEIRTELQRSETFQKEALAYFEDIDARLKRSIQGIETVRFNPFQGTGTGGNQSFSTVFINEHGNGVVLSGLHSRDRISIFSKPLKGFISEFELSDEEKGVMRKAQESFVK